MNGGFRCESLGVVEYSLASRLVRARFGRSAHVHGHRAAVRDSDSSVCVHLAVVHVNLAVVHVPWLQCDYFCPGIVS